MDNTIRIYYGFKISEDKIKKLFYNDKFIKCVRKNFEEFEIHTGLSYNNTSDHIDNINAFDFRDNRVTFKRYLDYYVFNEPYENNNNKNNIWQLKYYTKNEENAEYEPLIHSQCTAHCHYNNDSDWIIGINMANIQTSKKIDDLNFCKITNENKKDLNTLRKNFKLTDKEPQYYTEIYDHQR